MKTFIFQLEKLITKNYFLNLSAKEAFKAYVRAYESHSLKNIFNVQVSFTILINRKKIIYFFKSLNCLAF